MEKMVWPSRLTVFYPLIGQNVSVLYVAVSAAVLLAVTILILRFAKNHRYLVTGWFWYLGTLLPVIGLIPVGDHAMADRYSYITLTGLFIIIAWGLPDLLGKWQHRKTALWASSLAVLSVLAILAHIQQQYWKNNAAIFQHALKVTSNNYVAHFGAAAEFFEEGNYEEAIRHYREAVQIKPDYIDALNGLGLSLYQTGKIDEAIEYYRRAIEISPRFIKVYPNLGIALAAKGKFADAISLYNKGLQMAPDSVELHINLGNALARSGKLEEAVKEYEKVLKIAPRNAVAHNNLDIILLQQGNLQFDPDSAQGHYYLGQIMAQKGKIDEAIVHFEKSLRIEPNWVEPMNNLAWFLAASTKTAAHNPDRAIKLAQRVCKLTNYTKPEPLDTLAVAYAAAGDFSKAIKITEKALKLCQSSQQEALREIFKKRLVLYKAGKPYYE
jgi:protein O-mannosyl-transferase